jgi:hypothetical protein
MAKKKQKGSEEQDILQEAGLPPNWRPVDVEPVNPAAPRPGATAPLPNDMPPHFVGTLNPDMQHDKIFVGTEGRNPRVASTPLMPVGPQGNPNANAAIRSIIKINQSSVTTTSTGMNFRGTWNNFTPYSVNDVVIDNISSYVAVANSTNVEPDTGSNAWVLLGKNLNFRGVWSALNPVRQTNNQGAANGNATNVNFGSNVVAGNKVFVASSVRNIGTSATPVVSDSQGNVYTNIFTSARVSGNEYCIFGFLATIGQSGALTVFVSYSGGGPPGNQSATIAELTGVAGFDQSGTTAVGSGGPITTYPSFTVPSTNSGEFIIGAAFGENGVLSPTGWTQALSELGTMDVGGFFPSVSGNNTVQFIGSFSGSGGTSDTRFLAGAATIFVTGGAKYNPYDVVEFNGSMYLCVSSTNNSPASSPASWVLFAQATGLAQVKTANYTAIVTDEGSLLTFNTASAATLTLPATPPDSGWWISVMNIGTGTLTIARNGLTIDGVAANLTLGQNQGMVIFTDGFNYFTIHGVNSLSMPGIFVVGNPNGSGLVTVTLANENANTVWAGPTSGGAAPPSFRLLVNADLPATTPTVPAEFVVSGNVASPAGSLAITKANENANTVWAGPTSGGPGQPTFRPLVSADIPAPGMLALTEVQGTLQTGTVTGVIRLPGNVIPPKGIYRLVGYMRVSANPGAGNLDMAISFNDGITSHSISNGTDGAPVDISTAALNFSSGTMEIISDGIHDITFTLTLT